MELIKSANLAFRFLLELAVLAATSYWGATGDRGRDRRIVLAVVTPLVVAVVWMLFVAPRPIVVVPTWTRFLVEAAVFVAAVAALLRRARVVLASVLAAGYVVNRVLMTAWDQ